MSKYEVTGDDVFAQFINSMDQRQNPVSNSNPSFTNSKKFEDLKYVGLDKDQPKVVRFVGKPFIEGAYRTPTDAKELFVSKVKGDGGVFYLYLPLRCDDRDQDHLMWKIIDKVMEKTWIDKKSVYKNEIEHPDIFKLVDKGGFTEADGKWPYMYATGWKGKRVLLANCIDRTDSWCKDNNHTKLLSKGVNMGVDKNGNPKEWAEVGVPAYGFDIMLQDIIKNDGSWENYDIAVRKTGEKNNPFKMVNASKYVKVGMLKEAGLDQNSAAYVVDGPLTQEELDFDRYDLDKNFQVTSYKVINKYLGSAIMKIDATLGTNFYDKLQKLVEEERDNAGNTDPTGVVETTSNVSSMNEASPVNAPSFNDLSRVAADTDTNNLSTLVAYNQLTTEQKALIESVDGEGNITWTSEAKGCIPCDKCHKPFPSDWTICPSCGQKYSVN